jgi:hypothetical protein
MSAFGGKADVAADGLEGDAMWLLGWVTAANLTNRFVWPPSLFAYPVSLTAPPR